MFLEMETRPALFYFSLMCCLVGVRCTAQEPTTENNNGGISEPSALNMDQGGRMKLVQLDPIEVGHVYTMELEPGRLYQVKTVAVKPPIFIIPDFISPDEYTSIKSLAESEGLYTSQTVLREEVDDTVESITDPYFNTNTFNKFDEDNNGYLSTNEAREAMCELAGIALMTDSTFMRFVDDVVDLDSDREVSIVEFRRIPTILPKVTEWLDHHKRNDDLTPDELKKLEAGPVRISKQVWMDHQEYDPTGAIRNRLIKLTGLHPDIIKTSEELQVVRYTPGGHYHAHHDTTKFRVDRPCQHTKDFYPPDPKEHLREDRICRYITVLYYLVDTEEGGETAFPAADNATYSPVLTLRGNRTIDPIDLTHHCKDANLYVRPRQGMAVMWYNHYLDASTGWLGDRNDFSLHGGCDVIKGEKWIANNWINVDRDYDIQMKFHHEKLHKPRKEYQHSDHPDSTGGPMSGHEGITASTESTAHRVMTDEL